MHRGSLLTRNHAPCRTAIGSYAYACKVLTPHMPVGSQLHCRVLTPQEWRFLMSEVPCRVLPVRSVALRHWATVGFYGAVELVFEKNPLQA